MAPDAVPIVMRPDAYRHDDIEARALKRSQDLRHGTAHPAYSVDSNRLGVVGELATLEHLRAVLPATWSVDWIGDAPTDPADVLVRLPSGLAIGLEVKTTRSDWWRRHGRIVGADQMYATSARAYVWCVAARAIGLPDVYLLGWSVTEEMRCNWSSVTFTGVRSTSRSQTEQQASGHESEPAPYSYDADDVDVDEYELHANRWDRALDAPEGAALEWEMNASQLTSPSASAEGLPSPWQEGSEPLDGFGKVRELAKVNAALRGMGELPDWLRSQVRHVGEPP